MSYDAVLCRVSVTHHVQISNFKQKSPFLKLRHSVRYRLFKTAEENARKISMLRPILLSTIFFCSEEYCHKCANYISLYLYSKQISAFLKWWSYRARKAYGCILSAENPIALFFKATALGLIKHEPKFEELTFSTSKSLILKVLKMPKLNYSKETSCDWEFSSCLPHTISWRF